MNVRFLKLGTACVLLVELLLLVGRVASRVPLVVVLQVLTECLPLRQIRLVLELGVVGRHGRWMMRAAPVVQNGAERVLLGFVQTLLQLFNCLVVGEKSARSLLQLCLQKLNSVLLRLEGVLFACAGGVQLTQLLLQPPHCLLLLDQLLLQRSAILLQLQLLVLVLLGFLSLGSQLAAQSFNLVRLALGGQLQLLLLLCQVLVLLFKFRQLRILRGKPRPDFFQSLLKRVYLLILALSLHPQLQVVLLVLLIGQVSLLFRLLNSRSFFIHPFNLLLQSNNLALKVLAIQLLFLAFSLLKK